MQALNQFKNRLFIFSFGLGLASTVGIFQPNSTLKEIAKVALGFSIAGVAIGELTTGKAFSLSNQDTNKLDEQLRAKDKENIEITRKLDKTIAELNNSKEQSFKLENEIQQALEIIQSRNNELTNASTTIHELRNKLTTVGRFSTDEAYKMVRDTYKRSVRKLECHIEALMRNYAGIADDLNTVLIDVDKFRNRWITKLNEYETISDFNELLDTGLDYQQKIIEGCIELRVRGQVIVTRYLNDLLENSISIEMYETDITNLQLHAGATIKEQRDKLEQQIRAIATDFVTANNQHIERYQINYTELIEHGKHAVALLQEREALIEQMQAELEQLRKPWTFTGSIDYAVAGNSIINFYYHAYGYVLDAMNWQESETGYTLTFATGRNKVYLTADMLHDKDNKEQLAGLTNALQLPTFTPNYQNGLMVLEVVTRKPNKIKPIEKLEIDISKIWVSADKFESFVKNFERVRITAGSTGGKSPTAKNLALAIMKTRNGKGELRLYDPQHGSKKDFWNMPKKGVSHDDNFSGMKELCELIDVRRNGSNHNFVLYLFDEVDNTIANLGKKANEFRNLLKIAIKEGSHCNVGAIFIGQSADANEIPGMTHSNWNNCVAIHIGSNAGIAIDKLTTITTEDKTRLLEQYRKIQDYCDRKNEELGLDIFTDATAYRFALVVPLTGLPKFIQLPDFDSYEYSEVMQETSSKLVNELVNDSAAPTVQIKCPHCGSEKFRKHSRVSDATQYRYTCSNVSCKKTFVASKLTNSN